VSSKRIPVPVKQVEVQIMDQNYTLACTDHDEPGLLAAVHKIDATMCGIRDAGKIKARDRIAVLAGIHLAHELIERDAATAAVTHAQDKRLAVLLARLEQALTTGDRKV